MDKGLVFMMGAVLIMILISWFFMDVKRRAKSSERYFCKGTSRCFEGEIKDIIDGDTLLVDEEIVRLSLVNTPEKGEIGYDEAIDFIEERCPVGSKVIVDEDDMQTSRSHRRTLGVVYCFDDSGRAMNLNSELVRTGNALVLEDFCDSSEFSGEGWVTSYGCAS